MPLYRITLFDTRDPHHRTSRKVDLPTLSHAETLADQVLREAARRSTRITAMDRWQVESWFDPELGWMPISHGGVR